MRTMTLLLLSAITLVAADDPWAKVQEVKSGSELRVFKKGAKQPVLAKLDQVTEESVVIVVKNEQVAVPKEEIDRIDARPTGGNRVTRQTTTKMNAPGNPSPSDQRIGGGSPGPSSSSSSSLSFGGKPDFETVYRRSAGAPKK